VNGRSERESGSKQRGETTYVHTFDIVNHSSCIGRENITSQQASGFSGESELTNCGTFHNLGLTFEL
jgi:hypothetical protein